MKLLNILDLKSIEITFHLTYRLIETLYFFLKHKIQSQVYCQFEHMR